MRSHGLNKFSGPHFRRLTTAFLISLALALLAAPPVAKAAGSSEADRRENYERRFVLANAEFTLLHEISHVLIWELKPPIFGREEDAADTIAVLSQMTLPLRAGAHGELEKLQAVADGWKLEWQLAQEEALENAFWDLHALEIQRYYTIACLVYGADPARRISILKAAGLPQERAQWCREEYLLAKHAMDWLSAHYAPDATHAASAPRGKAIVQYARNATLEGEKLDHWLRESGLAEQLAQSLEQRFALPRDIIISFENCQRPNASWDAMQGKIQFCHTLMNRFLYLARELARQSAAMADDGIWLAIPAAGKAGASVNESMLPNRK